jgi:hypothetical protein
MMSIWGWIADLVLAALLVGTLVMSVRLDRALAVVRRDRAVFEALITNLASATSSVKLGIQALRNEADRAAEQIERRSEDADKLATDLSFLIDAANRASQRLDDGRQAAAAPPSPPASSVSNANANAEGKRKADGSGHQAGGHQAGGLRELVGIAQRRRVRTQGVVVRQTDLPAPKGADVAPVLGEPNAAFVAMEG